jgi:hypothetical protein
MDEAVAIYRLPPPFHGMEITRASMSVLYDGPPILEFGSVVLPTAGKVTPYARLRRGALSLSRRTA